MHHRMPCRIICPPRESFPGNLQSSIRPPIELKAPIEFNRARVEFTQPQNGNGPSASPSPQGSTIFVWWGSQTHEKGRSMGGAGGYHIYIYVCMHVYMWIHMCAYVSLYISIHVRKYLERERHTTHTHKHMPRKKGLCPYIRVDM